MSVDKEKLTLLSKFIPKIRNPTAAAAVASRSSKRKKTPPVRYTPEEMRRKGTCFKCLHDPIYIG